MFRLEQRSTPSLVSSFASRTIYVCLILFAGCLHGGIVERADSARQPKEAGAAQRQTERSKAAGGASPSESGFRSDPYLMLVNTAMARQMDAPNIAQFDHSPYDALAVSFVPAYDTSHVPSTATMQASIAGWKKSTRKDIWPWVYLNRMVGANDVERNPLTQVAYFQRFQGLDLDGKAGAQKDFLENWRNALRVARETAVPGIVCDLEFYNNYQAYDVAELARMTSLAQPDALNSLRKLGARMADIAAE